jgi:hypothetical protein
MKTITLTPKEIKALKKVLEYMNDSESTHYEEHMAEHGKSEHHIFHHVKILDKVVSKGK